jgi:hypothetical protein
MRISLRPGAKHLRPLQDYGTVAIVAPCDFSVVWNAWPPQTSGLSGCRIIPMIARTAAARANASVVQRAFVIRLGSYHVPADW